MAHCLPPPYSTLTQPCHHYPPPPARPGPPPPGPPAETVQVYEIAFCFPYSYSRVQTYLSNVCSRKAAYVKRERLANTVQKRRLDLLTISSPENLARIRDGTVSHMPIEAWHAPARIPPPRAAWG